MVDVPPIISVDDHVIEPPDLWERWLPAKFRARGPRVVRLPYEPMSDGEHYRRALSGPETDFWIYGDLSVSIDGSIASAGRSPEEVMAGPVSYEDMRPGFYELKGRLEDMTINGVERSMCFPTFPRFCGQTFFEDEDRELGLACITAYNNWMVEEWCGDSGGRLIPLCLIPLWDPHLAASEVRRNAARGVRAVAFSELPANLGLPSLYAADGHWDPFLEACDETGTVICIHIGSGSKFLRSSEDAPIIASASMSTANSQMCLVDWLMSGTMARFPSIKIALSESQIGWIPYVLERVDNLWKKAMLKIDSAIVEPPSTYYYGRVFGCMFEDQFGLKCRDVVGIDQITFESDYPHQDSLWPDTMSYAMTVMDGLPQDEVVKIVRGNAIDLFGLAESLS